MDKGQGQATHKGNEACLEAFFNELMQDVQLVFEAGSQFFYFQAFSQTNFYSFLPALPDQDVGDAALQRLHIGQACFHLLDEGA